jgi:cytoskeletal protein RodZ
MTAPMPSPTPTESDFGARIRHAREQRGMSLRQIADATKISVRALEALERNDFSRLPGGIFSRAFVRSYAVEIGADPDLAVRDFLLQCSPAGAGPGGHAVVEAPALGTPRLAPWTLLVVGTAVLAAAAILFWAFGVR